MIEMQGQTQGQPEEQPEDRQQDSSRIAAINDAFRGDTDFEGKAVPGLVVMTATLHERYTIEQMAMIWNRVRVFDVFIEDNDPYGEHDFGSFDFCGETIFWKIDYYEAGTGYSFGAEIRDQATGVDRVLTVMAGIDL